jgi:hypothetical protein
VRPGRGGNGGGGAAAAAENIGVVEDPQLLQTLIERVRHQDANQHPSMGDIASEIEKYLKRLGPGGGEEGGGGGGAAAAGVAGIGKETGIKNFEMLETFKFFLQQDWNDVYGQCIFDQAKQMHSNNVPIVFFMALLLSLMQISSFWLQSATNQLLIVILYHGFWKLEKNLNAPAILLLP